MGSNWDYFWMILDYFWGHFRIILGSFWDEVGIVLGRFGVVLSSFRHHFGVGLGCLWLSFGVFFAFLGQKVGGHSLGFQVNHFCGDPKTLFWRGHLELSIREQIRSNEHEWLEIWPVLDAKKAILHRDRKLCFARLSFKSILYRNRSVYKTLCAWLYGNEILRVFRHYWTCLSGFGPFLTRPTSFRAIFLSPIDRF